MLKPENRLNNNRAFLATYKQRQVFGNKFFTIYLGRAKKTAFESESGATISHPTKIGFVVSNKIHKRAVKRNRLKRLMRESVRLIIKNGESDALNSFQSIVIVARNEALGLNFHDIDKQVKFLFAGLAKNFAKHIK